MRFYHVPGRWKIEAEDGIIDWMEIDGNNVRICGTALDGKEMTIRMLSIPKVGTKQTLLYCQTLSQDQRECCVHLEFD